MKAFLLFSLGVIVGAGCMFAFDSTWHRTLERRELTRDVDIGKECYRRGQVPPVEGVLKKGSTFEVQGIKGGAAYVAFETNVDLDRLNDYSVVLARPTSP
jgi:hypothetical protein